MLVSFPAKMLLVEVRKDECEVTAVLKSESGRMMFIRTDYGEKVARSFVVTVADEEGNGLDGFGVVSFGGLVAYLHAHGEVRAPESPVVFRTAEFDNGESKEVFEVSELLTWEHQVECQMYDSQTEALCVDEYEAALIREYGSGCEAFCAAEAVQKMIHSRKAGRK